MEHQALLDHEALQDLKADQDHKGHPAHLAPLATVDFLEYLDSRELLAKLVHQDCLESQVPTECLEKMEKLDKLVKMESPDLQECQDLLARKVTMVSQVSKDCLDLVGLLESMVPRVTGATLVLMVQMVTTDHRDSLDHVAPQDFLELVVILVWMVSLVLMESKAKLERMEVEARKDSLVGLELQEAWDHQVKLDQREALELMEIREPTAKMVLLEDVGHAVYRVFKVLLGIQGSRVSSDRRVIKDIQANPVKLE